MKWLKIDDIAKETGLTKRTIRYYEQIGLLSPPQRSEGGARLYTEQDIERLKKIIQARDVLGFSLQDLKDYIEIRETVQMHHRVYKTSTNPSKQAAELSEIAAGLKEQLDFINDKLEKITNFKQETEELYQKVQTILKTKYNN
ncbi:MerR family transcriptional regulator [Bacillus songklensis]|uniref:MerR family transcriptional regulator n=1 Tax=Bacillus songklensis TaxID=1069116 RepID=A0ABV8B978_9BACI